MEAKLVLNLDRYGENVEFFQWVEDAKSENDFRHLCKGNYATKHHDCAGEDCAVEYLDREGWSAYSRNHPHPDALTRVRVPVFKKLFPHIPVDSMKRGGQINDGGIVVNFGLTKGAHKQKDNSAVVWFRSGGTHGDTEIWNKNPNRKNVAVFTKQPQDFTMKCSCTERCQVQREDSNAYYKAREDFNTNRRLNKVTGLCQYLYKLFPDLELPKPEENRYGEITKRAAAQQWTITIDPVAA